MSRPTSKSPRLREHGLGSFIAEKLLCKACGYDLRGLHMGQKCPECGNTIAISVSTGGVYAGLGHAPQQYLMTLIIGLAMIGISVPLDFMAGVAWARGVTQAAVFAMVPAVLWYGGVLLICTKRPPDQGYTIGLWETRFRLCAIGLMTAMFLSETCDALGYFAKPGSILENSTAVAAVVLSLAGAVGFFPLAVYLSFIADWGSDTGLMHRLRGIAWTLAVTALVVGAHLSVDTVAELMGHQGDGFVGFVRSILGLAAFPSGIIFYIAQIVLIISIIQLLSMVGWAKRNAISEVERDRRVAEKRRARAEELVRMTEPIEPVNTSDFLPATGVEQSQGEEQVELPQADTRTAEEIVGRKLDAYGLEGDS